MHNHTVLAIDNSGKGVPYGRADRGDGEVNHGFRVLKGRPERLSEIPELATDPAMRSLLQTINVAEGGLFSIGCLSSAFRDERGHGRTGYVEFALDSDQWVTDASNYFPIFFHFDRELFQQNYADPMNFTWELMGASFYPANVDGFTATVYLNTAGLPSSGEVDRVWTRGLGILEAHLSRFGPPPGNPFASNLQDASSIL